MCDTHQSHCHTPRSIHWQLGRFEPTALGFESVTVPTLVRAFAHGVMGRLSDPSWGGPIELFLVPPSSPRLV